MGTHMRSCSFGLLLVLGRAGSCAIAVPSQASLARKDRDFADRQRIQARAGFLPQGAVNIGYAYNSPDFQDRGTFSFVALNGIREFTALGNVLREIDTFGRLRADYARAKANQQAAVAGAYYRLLLARHLVDAIRSSPEESRHLALFLRAGLRAPEGDFPCRPAALAADSHDGVVDHFRHGALGDRRDRRRDRVAGAFSTRDAGVVLPTQARGSVGLREK